MNLEVAVNQVINADGQHNECNQVEERVCHTEKRKQCDETRQLVEIQRIGQVSQIRHERSELAWDFDQRRDFHKQAATKKCHDG